MTHRVGAAGPLSTMQQLSRQLSRAAVAQLLSFWSQLELQKHCTTLHHLSALHLTITGTRHMTLVPVFLARAQFIVLAVKMLQQCLHPTSTAVTWHRVGAVQVSVPPMAS